jgi:hypothetical protein
MLYFEVFLMFEPQKIKVDLFRLMSVRGNMLMRTVTAPCGASFWGYKPCEKYHFERFYYYAKAEHPRSPGNPQKA